MMLVTAYLPLPVCIWPFISALPSANWQQPLATSKFLCNLVISSLNGIIENI
jgi:hypothetical protein